MGRWAGSLACPTSVRRSLPCRRALVEEAAAQFDLASSSTDAGIVRARLGSGVEAEARLVGGWPAGPDVVHITQVRGIAWGAFAV